MFTALIVASTLVFWWRAHKQFLTTGRWKYRRLRACWIWACVGAFLGGSFGIAGFGTAIAGTLPGALLGYLAAGNLMKKDFDESDEWPDTAVNDLVVPRTKNRSSSDELRSVATTDMPEAPAQSEWREAALGVLVLAFLAAGWLFIDSQTEKPPSVSDFRRSAPPSIPSASDQSSSRQSMPRQEDVRDTTSSQGAAASVGEASRECRFKGVMTNDDYRACGISPP